MNKKPQSALTDWTPESWKDYPALQQPLYPEDRELKAVTGELAGYPPLVFSDEARALRSRLAEVADGKAILLHGGDCAEAFADFTAGRIQGLFKLLLQAAVVLTFGGELPVVKLARIAGQFAKPRSSDFEDKNGIKLPSYRGDIINGPEFEAAVRMPDPRRMITAYHQSAASLNLLRAYAQGGLADLSHVLKWNIGFLHNARLRDRYTALTERISEALRFMQVLGINSRTAPVIAETQLFTSHEALLLPYEQALTRFDPEHESWYASSAHYLWIGERTRAVEGAHVEFCRGIANPVGVKIGPGVDAEELVRLVEVLNPNNIPGRITLITRMGAGQIEECLPPLIRRIKSAGCRVIWVTDPMHANTTTTASGYKTRDFDAVIREMLGFFAVHRTEGSHAGGVHLEMTSDDVTECTGGAYNLQESDLGDRYRSFCDPRLNGDQVLELAFRLADSVSGLQ